MWVPLEPVFLIALFLPVLNSLGTQRLRCLLSSTLSFSFSATSQPQTPHAAVKASLPQSVGSCSTIHTGLELLLLHVPPASGPQYRAVLLCVTLGLYNFEISLNLFQQQWK